MAVVDAVEDVVAEVAEESMDWLAKKVVKGHYYYGGKPGSHQQQHTT